MDTGHVAYKCPSCDSTFSRRDVMLRHGLQHSAPTTKYSCKHCKKWRAPNGFKRQDHLIQHMRNYHHIENEALPTSDRIYYRLDPKSSGFYSYCLHEECTLFRSPLSFREQESLAEEPLFSTRSAFTKHMRSEHDRSLFPCTSAGCKRVNGKGFFQKRAFIKHMKAEHGIDPLAKADGELAHRELDGVMEAADSNADHLAR